MYISVLIKLTRRTLTGGILPVGLPLSIESSIHSDSFVDEKTYISAVIAFLNFSVRVRAADRLDASSSSARIALTGTSGL